MTTQAASHLNPPARTHHREDRDLAEIFRDDAQNAGHPAAQVNMISVSPTAAQSCPRHSHATLFETFICVSGVLKITVDGLEYTLTPGQSVTVAPLSWHSLRAAAASIYLEVRSLPFDAQNPDKTFDDASEEARIALLNAAGGFLP